MLDFLIDLLFPKICVACQAEGSWFCRACLDAIPIGPKLTCPDCLILSVGGRYCSTHRQKHQLTGLIYVDSYKNKIIQRAIQGLKYDGIRELSIPLSQLLATQIALHPNLKRAIVLPVPLHRKRLIERGFNQSELLANKLPMTQYRAILVRYQARPAQASLTDDQRRQNVRFVFGIIPETLPIIQHETVVLVDDVSTTGSTLDSAAEVLLRAGADRVWGAVIAKG